jgi:hypothetical protein
MDDKLIHLSIVGLLSVISVQLLIPCIMMIQNIISVSNTLASNYNGEEFKIASSVMLMFYVPIFVILSGLTYQFDGMFHAIQENMFQEDLNIKYDKMIIIFTVLYVANMTVPNLFK